MQGTPLDLSRLRDTLESHLPGLADEIALAVAAHAPVGKGETAGRLRDDLHAESEMDGDGATITVVSGVPEATFVIEGTAPHEIWPLHPKDALFWEGADHPYGHVHHPGTQPNPFGDLAQEQIDQLIEDEMDVIFQEAFGD